MLAAFLAAGFVHGVAGFGRGIVAMSITRGSAVRVGTTPVWAKQY